MPVPRACRIMRDVARAVRAAHEVGIVHRDLKPDNIMIADRDGEFIKVLDFGISASAERSEGERLTVQGQALGTPEYMSPEQALGHDATPLFDVYALGAIFFELLTGEPPFAGSNVVEVMTRKTTTDARAVSRLRDDIPDALAKLIDECLAREPSERPQSVRVFLSRLEEVLRGLPRENGVLTPAPAAVVDDDEHRGPGWLFPVFILLGAAGFVAMLAIMGRDSAAVYAPRGDRGGGTQMVTPPNPLPREPTPEPRPEPTPVESDGAAAPTGEPVAEPSEASGASKPAPDAETDTPEPVASTSETGDTGETGAEPEALPEYASGACRRTRAQAEDSAKAAAWKDVLSRTKKRDCWARKNDRLELEVLALRELGRFEQCVKKGKYGSSAKLKG